MLVPTTSRSRALRGAAWLATLALLLSMLPGGRTPAHAQGSPMTFTTVQDFSAPCSDGSAPTLDGTVVTEDGDGEISLAAQLEDYFRGTTLDTARWITGTYLTQYPDIIVANGSLTITTRRDGRGYVQSVDSQEYGVLEGVITFSAGEHQYFGFVEPGQNPSQFATIGTNFNGDGIYAVAADGATRQAVLLSPILSIPRRLRIEWSSVGNGQDQIRYFLYDLEANLVATQSLTVTSFPTNTMHIRLSNNPNRSRWALSAAWIRYTPYAAPSATYLSCPIVVDPHRQQVWGPITWSESVPAGTSLTVELRVANDLGSLATAPFVPVTNGGIPEVSTGIYAQYRLQLNAPAASLVAPKLNAIGIDAHVADVVTPASARYGTQFLVYGGGFAPNATLAVAVDGQLLSAMTANQFGEFAFYLDSTNARVASHVVGVSGAGRSPLTLNFVVTDIGAVPPPVPGGTHTFAMPMVASAPVPIIPSSGLPGTRFRAQGGGFARGATLAVELDGNTIDTTPADSNGEFSYILDSTGLAAGPHTLTFSGPAFGGGQPISVTFNFTIVTAMNVHLPLVLR